MNNCNVTYKEWKESIHVEEHMQFYQSVTFRMDQGRPVLKGNAKRNVEFQGQ